MMTTRERWLAALRLEPVDRLPFWPKLDGAFARAQAAPFCQMSLDELHRWVGSDRHAWVGSCVTMTHRACGYHEILDGQVLTRFYQTPCGVLRGEEHFDAASQAWYPVEHPLKRPGDLMAMTAWYADLSFSVDERLAVEGRERLASFGEEAIVGTAIGTSPLMHFIEFLAGAEQAHLFLADYEEEVEALFAAMHAAQLQRTTLAVEADAADLLYLMENTSTTLLSPTQYRRYCLPHLTDYGRLLCDAGRIAVVHMCGHLKKLLPDLAHLPVHAFEAFTSPTVGDTTLLDGRAACPRTCLIGGTNAALWLRSAAEITAQLDADLDMLPHHRGLVITSAGVMPPACDPETIRAVGDWVRQYQAILGD